MKRHFGLILRLLVSLGLILFVLYRFRDRLPLVAETLTSANLWLVALGVLLFWGAMTINALKWWVLLRAQDARVPFMAVVNYTFVGFFFNNLLPANVGGDVMRGYGLARYTSRTAAAAASVVLDRIVGLSAYISVAGVSALITVFATGREELSVLVVAAAATTLALVVIAALLLSRRVRRLVDRLVSTTFLRPLMPIWVALSHAFEAYRFRYKSLAVAFGVGLLGIATTATLNYVLSQSLGGGIGLLHIFLFTPAIAMVLIVPVSIGGLGLSQVAYPFFYSLVGVPTEHALALSLFVQATQLFCSLPGGLLWLRWRRRASGVGNQVPVVSNQ